MGHYDAEFQLFSSQVFAKECPFELLVRTIDQCDELAIW